MTRAALAAVLLLAGCASIEQRQLSWQGGPFWADPCLIGGVTDRATVHCEWIRSGDVGVLGAVNEAALADVGPAASCREHAIAVMTRLSALAVPSEPVYSCPPALRQCHVSALATARDGRRYVLDNGAAIGSPEIVTLERFAHLLGERYWIGRTPMALEAAFRPAGMGPAGGAHAASAAAALRHPSVTRLALPLRSA
ncbi:MAG TPA: hypothetical protein VM369_10775, partial [Candidatus Binatia bacterium]|nr:hypothetical protein [Candidatus Binatia bacterium]